MSEQNQTEEEARIWVLRVASNDMSDKEKHLFETWLTAESAHRSAFEEARRLWQMLGELEEDFTVLDQQDPIILLEVATAPPSFAPHSDTKQPVPATFYRRQVSRAAALMAAVLTVAAVFSAENIWIAAVADATTGPGKTLEISLPDNSSVMLNTETAIAVDYSPTERLIRLLKGEAFFKVQADTIRPFRVATPHGSSEAVGTSFAVRRFDDSMVITVEEGEVLVRSNVIRSKDTARRQKSVTSGQQIIYNEGGAEILPRNVESSKELAWRKGKILFEDVAFSKAISELDRYFTGRILVISRINKPLRVSGVFQLTDINSAIHAVAEVQGLSIIQTPGNHFLILY